ncbi:MAG: 3-phosphoshikimate 1-carboxyvinyltransferase, partial [Bacteroidales bacterium]|nr:3-phosphoshikimate 1-carboxyvinyltransferase [Bacteroidales bacterium]
MTIPFSKSEYNRLLILSYLYGDHIPKPSYDCPDDVKLLYKTLDEFPQRTINCDNAGTVLRFMLSVVAAKRQPYPIVITGSERMLERPIEPLVSILQLLGADISYIGKNGFPPVIVNGSVIPDGVSEIFFNDVVSSQFVSSIMMIAPVFTHGLIIHYKNIPSFE